MSKVAKPHLLKRRSATAGFTLVEVLVALMVMAIMAVMAWQGVDGIVRARDSNQVRLERSLRLNTVISQWEQDLAALQETNVVSAWSFNGSSMWLTRRTAGGLQGVVWSLWPDDSGNSLKRWAGPAVTTSGALQDSWLRSQQFQGTEPGQLRTLSGVEQWQLYCFVGGSWTNCQSTRDLAPPAPGATAPPRQALPAAVRLVLTFAPSSGNNGSLIRDIQVSP